LRRILAWGKLRPAWLLDPGRRLDMSSGQAPADGPDYKREGINAKVIEDAESRTNG
jgi:hypothetical protein